MQKTENPDATQGPAGQKDDRVEIDESQLTKLNYKFSFWFSYFKEQRMKQTEDYENNIKKIGDFESAEEFWGYYQHIRRPDSLPKCCEFFLFKAGIRPLWEDPVNKGGGRFVLHIKRIFANKTWEDIIIAFIITTMEHDHLNGVVINVRSWEVLLSIWMKPLASEELKEKYRNWIRKSLSMSDNIKIEYKEHPNPEDVKNKHPVPPQTAEGKPYEILKPEQNQGPKDASRPEEPSAPEQAQDQAKEKPEKKPQMPPAEPTEAKE